MGDNMELTESNAIFTYAERCKNASVSFINGIARFRESLGQEYIATVCAMYWQVEIVDMLAETNRK